MFLSGLIEWDIRGSTSRLALANNIKYYTQEDPDVSKVGWDPWELAHKPRR